MQQGLALSSHPLCRHASHSSFLDQFPVAFNFRKSSPLSLASESLFSLYTKLAATAFALLGRALTTPPARRLVAKALSHSMSSLKRKASGSGPGPEIKKPKANGNIAAFFGAAPKPAQTAAAASSAAAPAPPTKFDKEKWLASLTPEQRKLLTLEIETMHESWLGLLKDDITTKEFLDLKKFLDRETAAGKKWFPPKEDVYSWCVALTPIYAHCYKLSLTCVIQVPTYTLQRCQGCHCGPGSVPQCEPGARHGVLGATTDAGAALASKHVHCSRQRLPGL